MIEPFCERFPSQERENQIVIVFIDIVIAIKFMISRNDRFCITIFFFTQKIWSLLQLKMRGTIVQTCFIDNAVGTSSIHQIIITDTDN